MKAIFEKMKRWAGVAYNYIATRPSDTWLHFIFCGLLPAFAFSALWGFFVGFGVSAVIAVAKEIHDRKTPAYSTCEWRDIWNSLLGGVVGATMGRILIWVSVL